MIHQPVILLGLGGVGRSLLGQILACRRLHRTRYGLRLDIEAVFDSSGGLLGEPDGLEESRLRELLQFKSEGGRIRDFSSGVTLDAPLSRATSARSGRSLLIDCTAEETGRTLMAALDGGGLVLANKKPLTGRLDDYLQLTNPSRRSRWEATVGSGVPIIATLARLAASGDRVTAIRGAASGSLGRLMTGLQAGRSFSEIMRQAQAEGATEPDPRDDLSGADVARKALILARGMGLGLELSDVVRESLCPPTMDDLTRDGFLDTLPELDDDFRRRSQAAQRKGKVLRYALKADAEGCSAGLIEVPLESPLGQLKGADNLFEITSRCYPEEPLVLQGRGAGVEATASGVLADVLELTRCGT